MLDDRPDMRGVLDEDSAIRDWIIAAFNGEQTGKRVYWNSDTPASGRPAEHLMPYMYYPGAIRISGGTETTPTDKWASVVFELFNLTNASDFDALNQKAIAGELDSKAYASACVALEFRAIKMTSEFFASNPLPDSKHRNDIFYQWMIEGVGTFEEYKAAFDGVDSLQASNFKYFEEYYNTSLVPYQAELQLQE